VSLREYQTEAIDAIYKFWSDGGQRGGTSLPTGTGKTHIMGEIARRDSRDGVVAIVLHRDTLVEQTARRLRDQLDPGTSVGVVKAERNEVGARVLVCSVHSLRRADRLATLPPIRTCIVDEAHVSVSPIYKRLFDHIGAFTSGRARLTGYSATWSRSDETGLGDVWEKIVYRRGIQWAVKHGHLVTPRGIQVGDGVSLAGVRTAADGDYREGDLERVVMLEDIRDLVVAGAHRHAAGRPGVLFAPTIAAAEYFATALTESGIRTEGIYATTPAGTRRLRFAGHRDGSVKILSTCTALAEGWDAPWCSVAHFVRPMRHPGLFVQTAGRVLRPWPGKPDALLLDYVGLLDNLSLRAEIDLDVTRESAAGEPVEAPELDEEELPERRERTVRRRRVDLAVELFAGTPVQWLTSPVGLPFVACGDVLVALVEGPDGWNVAEVDQPRAGLPPSVRPQGRWIARGLDSEAALEIASDHAECSGEYLSRRSATWRRGQPSEAQEQWVRRLGKWQDGLNRGQCSDLISISKAGSALAHLAEWSNQWKEWQEHSGQ
jgi:superfamily II DNA or RNA helicase